MESIKSKIRTIPNFPKEGIMFRDITTLLQSGEGLNETVSKLVERYKSMNIDVVAGIEARGFIIGGILAHQLGVGFVPIRKKGKLPFKTERHTYDLEYGTDTIEMHVDAISPSQNVLIVDDLLATGGTCLAASSLVKKLGGNIVECAFIVDLPALKGKERLLSNGLKVFNLVEFEGE